MVKRWTAYKMNVADIINSKYTDGGFIQFGNLHVNRVRILGTIVAKFIADSNKYGFFIIDDGTETIRIRSFEDQLQLIENVNIGDIVDVFGKIRLYEEEIYVIPEIVKKVDGPNWVVLRKLELLKQKKQLSINKKIIEPENEEENLESSEEEVIETTVESPRQKIIKLIKELDKGDGTDILELNKIIKSDDMVLQVLTDLMNEGEVFEPRPGRVKLLE